jgi:hypothetical protein
LSRISIRYLLNVTLNPGGFLTQGGEVGIEGLPEGTRILVGDYAELRQVLVKIIGE